MKLQIIDNETDFFDLRQAWQSITVAPLRSFDWHCSWWKAFGGRHALRIYVMEQDGVVVGIAPFLVDRWVGQNRLRFIGSGRVCTDYGQIIVANEEDRQAFSEAIVADIQQSDCIQMVELEGVSDQRVDQFFGDCLNDTHWCYERPLEPTWIISLPESWEKFVSLSNRTLRRKIRKAERRINSGEVTIRSTLDGLEFEKAFEALVELHQRRFISKGKQGVFSDPRFTAFLKETAAALCAQGRAEIITAEKESTPFASQIYLISAAGPQLYQAGVCPDRMDHEPGHLMFTHAVRKSIENGYTTFDFLRGDEPYKPMWGAVRQPLLRIRYVSKTLTPTAVNQTYRALRQVKVRCKSWVAGFKAN